MGLPVVALEGLAVGLFDGALEGEVVGAVGEPVGASVSYAMEIVCQTLAVVSISVSIHAFSQRPVAGSTAWTRSSVVDLAG